MDDGERKSNPPLPPNYVSLAQLQERWIQKLKKKEEGEQKEGDARTKDRNNENQNHRGLENDLQGKMADLSVRDVPRREGGKDDRKMGVLEDKGKGKDKVFGGFQDGEGKKKKKKKKRSFEKKKSMAEGENSKPGSGIKEFDGGQGSEGEENVPGNEVKVGIKGVLSGESSGREKGTEEIGGVSMVDVLPRNGVRREIQDVKRVDYRSGFRRNGYNRGSGYNSKNEYGKKMEDEKGHGNWWRERRRNGDYREHHRLKENRVDVLKGIEAELKAEDEVLEVCNEIVCVNEKDKDDDRVELEKNTDDEVLMVESAKTGENRRIRNGYRRDGNQRENTGRKFGGFSYNDRRNMRSITGVIDGAGRKYTRFGGFADKRRPRPRESGMVWMKKEEKNVADAAEVG